MSDGDGWVRAPVLDAMESAEGLTLFAAGRPAQLLPGPSGAVALAVLAFATGTPRTRAEIVAHVEALSGEPLVDPAPIDQLLGVLSGAGALVRPTPPQRPPALGPRVLLALTGAVQAAHAPLLVSALQARGHQVRVIASPSALRFVARRTLESLTHAAVPSSTWSRRGGFGAAGELRVAHVELAAWPDAMIVWPATATTISRIAAGDCSTLVSATAVTTKAPVLVAPSMNPAMLEAPSVARNLAALVADRFHVLAPVAASEVADAPGARTAAVGGAPPPELVVRALGTLLRSHPRAALPARLPADASEWDRYHRRTPEGEQAWFLDAIDPALARLVRAHARPAGLFWDVGTGHGANARWAAESGYQVVATDVSETALARAAAHAGELRITFVRDDVTASALASQFDVVVDRGTLHVLPIELRSSYARTLVARTRPGAVIVVSCVTGTSPTLAHPLTRAELEALFADHAEVVVVEDGTFAGTVSPAPSAVTAVLRRK